MANIGIPPAKALYVSPSVRLTRQHSDRYWAATSAAFTTHTTWEMEADFEYVRLIYGNDAAASYDVTVASVAATSAENVAGGYTPLNAAGGAGAFTQVTFNSAGADSDPPAAAGTTATVTVPAATSGGGDATDHVTPIIFSDWIPLQSIARSNGCRFPFLMVRTYGAGAGRGLKAQTGMAAWQADRTMRFIHGIVKAGDFATGGGSMTTVIDTGWWTPFAIQYYARTPGITFASIGDSLSQGLGTASDLKGWPVIAANALSSARLPISHVHWGVSGSGSSAFYARAKLAIDKYKPQVVTFPVFTPNDATTTPTQSIVDAAYRRAVDFVYYAESRGTRCILMSPLPWRYSSTYDPLRVGILNRLRAQAANGTLLMLDCEAALSDGAIPARLKPEYLSATTGSDPHPNDAGHAAMAAAFIPLLAKAING